MSKYEARISFGKRFLAVAALLGAGYLSGMTSREAIVQAEVRPGQNPPQNFETGTEVLLREISATLGKMDARVERMERLATQFAASKAQEVSKGNR